MTRFLALFQKPWFVVFVSILALWLNFSAHFLSTLPLKKFLDGEFPSERYVFSRLVYNLDHGTDAEGGFLLAYDHVDDLYKSVNRDDYADFKERTENGEDSYSTYPSHKGLQDDLLFPIWLGLEKVKALILENAREGSRWEKRLQTLDHYYYQLITQTLVALLGAITLSLFILWVIRQFSSAHAWILLGLMLLLLPVLTFYGRSMWWMLWSWFAPMLVVLWGLYGHNPPRWPRTIVIGIGAGAFLCLKALMGYEFVIPAMMATLIPIAFAARVQEWPLKIWFSRTFVIGSFVLCGAIASLVFHGLALAAIGVDPVHLIQQTLAVRSWGGELASDLQGEMLESTTASFFGVVLGFLFSGKELGLPQILLMAPFLVWAAEYWRKGRQACNSATKALSDAFCIAIGFGFVGAIAMLTVLKGHAYIHGYDVVIWTIPLNLYLLTFYAWRILKKN